jgi:hypothetical protein
VASYDRQHDCGLLQTLEAVLRYPTLADTAKALHVLRNTLLYRLQRIREIADLPGRRRNAPGAAPGAAGGDIYVGYFVHFAQNSPPSFCHNIRR